MFNFAQILLFIPVCLVYRSQLLRCQHPELASSVLQLVCILSQPGYDRFQDSLSTWTAYGALLSSRSVQVSSDWITQSLSDNVKVETKWLITWQIFCSEVLSQELIQPVFHKSAERLESNKPTFLRL